MSYADENAVVAWLDAGNGDGLYMTARLLLVELARYRREDTGTVWRNRKHFSRRWGLREPTVKDAMRRLRRDDYIELVQRGTWSRSSTYQFDASFLDSIAEYRKPIGDGETTPTERDRGGSANRQGMADHPTGDGETTPNQSSSRSPEDVGDEDSDSDADAPPLELRIGSEDAESIIEDIIERLQLSRGEAVDFINERMNARKSSGPIGYPVAYFKRVVTNELANRAKGEKSESKNSSSKKTTSKKPTKSREPCPHPECDGTYTKQGMSNHLKTHKTTCPRCRAPGVQWSMVNEWGYCYRCWREAFEADLDECTYCRANLKISVMGEHEAECGKRYEDRLQCNECERVRKVRGGQKDPGCECGILVATRIGRSTVGASK